MRNRNAFTLVELLVVIAIIALLISILLPTMSSVRRQAETVACRSNIRQMGNALRMYANDFKDHYPTPAAIGDLTGAACAQFRRGIDAPDPVNPAVKETLGLHNMFYQRGYLKSKEIWVCPSQPDFMKSYGNTYIWLGLTSAIAGYTSKQRSNSTREDTPFLYDNYLQQPYATNVPRNSVAAPGITTIPAAQYVYPHPYRGKVKTVGMTGKRQGMANTLFIDGSVGMTWFADQGGTSPKTISLHGEP